MGAQAGLLHDVVDLLAQRVVFGFLGQTVDQVPKTTNRIAGPGGQLLSHFAGRRPHGQLVTPRPVAHLLQRGGPDAARGLVDHAFKGRIVGTILNQPQIGQRILDFGAFIEAETAIDPVGHLRGQQSLFQRARHGI